MHRGDPGRDDGCVVTVFEAVRAQFRRRSLRRRAAVAGRGGVPRWRLAGAAARLLGEVPGERDRLIGMMADLARTGAP